MKQFLLLIFTLLLINTSTQSFSQKQNFCGTELSEKQKDWLIDYVKNGKGFAQKRATKYYVPLYAHFVGTDLSTGFYGANQMMKDICKLNNQFAPAKMYFYLAGFNYISNSVWFDHDNYYLGEAMMQQNNVGNVVNIYVVDNSVGRCGYYSPFRDGVVASKSCMGKGGTILAHELGHYFSLPHPFSNVRGIKERVDGSNCTVGGDLFCDTRADHLSILWQCPYQGNELDENNDPYDPDETLFMSYSSNTCQNRFSNEQIDAMAFNVNTQRPSLIGSTQDTTPLMLKVKRLFPHEGMPQKPTNATFRWSSVPNAMGYILQASQISVFPGNLPLEVITSDTFYVATKLVDGISYNWRVRPVYAGRTCGESKFSDTGRFFASITAGLNDFTRANEVKIYPNPTSNYQQVFIAFKNEVNTISKANIYTIEGKSITSLKLNKQSGSQYSININSLNTGIYFIDIKTDSGVYRQKLLVK